MFKKKKKEEGHDNQERWLLTYADLITLLLGLFVILYASSKIDEEKFKEMMKAMNKQLGSGSGIMPGNISPIINNNNVTDSTAKTKLDSIQETITESIKNISESQDITFDKSQFGLVMHFKDRLLFEVGKADLKTDSYELLNAIAQELKKLPNEILIEGHTDTIPIKTIQFPSNVHLSSARATNTYLFLTEDAGFPRDRISIRGFGEFKPLVTNNSELNRAKNRRVDIVVVTDK